MDGDAQVRGFVAGDADEVRALNVANEPAVGPLDDERLRLFAGDRRVVFDVVERSGAVVALFVGLPHGVDAYASPNYRWFAGRHERFAYVDRVAVATTARGSGLGRHLYARWFAHAADRGLPVVCAEVNVDPPNRPSLAFHERLGFVEVGRQRPYGADAAEVVMLERTVADVAGR